MSSKEDCTLIEIGYSFNTDRKGFHRGDYIHYQKLPLFVKSRSDYSCFRSAYSYDNQNVEQSNLYGDLYLDFDDENNFNNVKEDVLTAISYFKICYRIPENYIKIYFSGKKGIHLTIPAEIFNIKPMPLLNGVFKYIANSVNSYIPNKTLDLKIYDNRRMFRIPNTKHESSSLYKIPITYDELKNLDIQQIKLMAYNKRYIPEIDISIIKDAERTFEKTINEYYIFDKENKKDKRFATKINFTPHCIQYILENGAVKGQRNMSIACLSSFYKSYGISKDEALDLITTWNSKNLEPTPQAELKSTVNSLYNTVKTYGCQTLSQISVCDEVNCKISKKKKERKNNVIASKNQKAKSKSNSSVFRNLPSCRSRFNSMS